MPAQRRFRCLQGGLTGCLVALLVTCPAVAAEANKPTGSVVLADFEDDGQFAHLGVRAYTRVEPATEASQGKRAARIHYSAVPDGIREYPALVIENEALRVRDFTPFEAISLSVLNAGSADAELSLSIWDRAGNRAFPIPSTVTVKPGRWQQVVVRLVLHGLDARQIGSIHLYQKVNRQPVTLLIDDVQLLSPHAGRIAARIQLVRENLKSVRGSAEALGAKGQIEPKVSALSRRLESLEALVQAGGTAAQRTQRLAELARIATESQDLARSIRIRNGGKEVFLSGPHVEANWLSDPSKVRRLSVLGLSHTSLGDDGFASLAPARDIEVLGIDGKGITGAGLDKLPGNKLRSLSMENSSANDSALRHLERFPELQELYLAETSVTSGVFKHLENLKKLKILALDGTGVADAGFSRISKLTGLGVLHLGRTRISGDSLRHLGSLDRLQTLDLRDTKVDDAGLSYLGKLVRLETLVLENTPITGASFGQLEALDNLVVLNLGNTRVGDSALRRLGRLPRLKRLELSGTRITDESLRQLGSSAPLEYLDLYGTNITDAGLAHLQNQKGLQELYLGGTQTSDVGIGHLKRLTGLVQLDLEGTQVTDAGLEHLRGMTSLVSLKLGKTRLTGQGLTNLAGLSELRVLDLSGTGLIDEALAPLARLPKLRTLNLRGTRVTSKGMGQLRAARQLVELDVEATEVGNPGLELLAALPNLQRLNLNETAVTDEGLQHLKTMEKLRVLSVSRTRITDEGIVHLRDTYADLDLAHTRITDQAVEHLQRNGQLVRLRLASTGITNDTLRLLQATPTLRQLDVAGTRIDDAGLQHLLLPDLEDLNLSSTFTSDRGIESLATLSGLRRLSLENSRVTARGASYLKNRSPEIQLELTTPWAWGERWSNYELSNGPAPVLAPPDSTELPRRLKDLAGLGYLRLDQSSLTPELLRTLKDLPTLEHLSFQGSGITDEMLTHLLGLSQVARLDLSATPISDRGLAHLKDMQRLRELNLQGTGVTGSGFENLAALARLQALNLRETPLAENGLAHLGSLQELRTLELSNTRTTDAGIGHLVRLPRLQYLDLYGTALTDTGLERLSQLKSLRYCYLSNTKITDAGVAHLRQLSELEELGLDGTQVTDQGLAVLSSLTNLRGLRLGRTRVTDAGLAQVAVLAGISRLELADLSVTDTGVESLQGMSALQTLDLSGTAITDDALTVLARFPALAELDVRDTALTPEAIERFRRARPGVKLASGATRAGYSAWSAGLFALYGLAACAICFYGLHRYWMAWLFVRDRQARSSPEPKARFSDLPAVTVQLPMYNERSVAERVIEAACALDYPRDRLQVQVLDDSTDESAAIARRCCERMAGSGHPVEYLHRSARAGFKGGALAAGLEKASGEFIAVFDADFVPPPDFLQQTLHHFTDATVGMVQAEWSHLNREESLLTELQAMFLDGHFVVEQTIRSRRGRWFNFNGTAGVWRRRCIEEAGGWQHDTLTEDTDLSYRAQLKGWKFLYLPAVRCGGELPSTVTAFLGQQHRWTKGLIQTAKKLLPRILLSPAPWTVKAEAWFHLTSPVMYLVMLVVTAIALPALFVATPLTDRASLGLTVGLGTLCLGTLAAATFYFVAQRAQGFPLGRTLARLPVLMALGIGMCAVNARAVVEALLGFRSPFVRTPKFGGRRDCDPDAAGPRRRLCVPAGLLELVLGGVLYACLVLSFLRPFTLIGSPFLLLFALGYSGVGLLRLLDRYDGPAAQVRPSSFPRLRPVFSRIAVTSLALAVAGSAAVAVVVLTSPAEVWGGKEGRRSVAVGLDLTTARWQVAGRGQPGMHAGSAVEALSVDRGSLVLNVRLDEKTDQGEIILDLDGALAPLGESMSAGRQVAFDVEYPSRFTGEFQAFVRDSRQRSQYGSMAFVESHDVRRAVTVALLPSSRVPPMGYQDKGFDPSHGVRQLGFKISAQSDRVRGAGYRAFRGTVRVARVRVSDVDHEARPEPEVRPPDEHHSQPLQVLTARDFLAASGVDRPWPLGYAFSGPITDAHKQELQRTYSALGRLGCLFTRVYLGDYRTGLVLDGKGKTAGVEPAFVEYLDQLAAIANRHGVVVMFSLTDNTSADGRGLENVEFIREGEASELFINNVLARLVGALRGRQVIWDVFNEPENVTAVPLREVQRYVERVLAACRQADPNAHFTVVSRSRPEVAYWQGRGLDLYSHNIFSQGAIEEAVAAPRVLDAPIMVAEMAPQLATERNLNALRQAGYAGIGIWGWGTRDKYDWSAAELERKIRPLIGLTKRPQRSDP